MKVSDHRWVVVLEALQQRNDPRELVKAMVAADFEKPPEWVREELTMWSQGKLPPDPKPLSAGDKNLERALIAYESERSERPNESPLKLRERIAEQFGLDEKTLYHCLSDKQSHRAVQRILAHYRATPWFPVPWKPLRPTRKRKPSA